ncbi:MAG: hypothetical protein COB84_08375 [Rhodobacteraceae bacterium]|nr:MAG: hypothetical protein COB84_08375 [Paracoccaceae bacterium]
MRRIALAALLLTETIDISEFGTDRPGFIHVGMTRTTKLIILPHDTARLIMLYMTACAARAIKFGNIVH